MSHLLSLFVAAALATATLAQEAQIETLRGCTFPAPADSLRGALVDPNVWVADANDFIAFEVESVPDGNDWSLRADPNKPGFSGTGYFEWTGRNFFSSPGNGIREFRVFIRRPGTYQIRAHNRHDDPDPSEENDCWMRVNGREWFKAFSNDGNNAGVWNWDFRMEPRNIQVQASLFEGVNTIEISGRSTGFQLDRIHVFKDPNYPFADLSLPISEQLRSRPIPGQLLAMEADDPNGETGLPAGTTQAVLIGSLNPSVAAPCGVPLPGFGPTGGNGELMLGLVPDPFSLSPVGVAWNGPGNPALLTFPVPNNSQLLGFVMYAQAALVDLSAPRVVLTDAAKLTFGSF